MREYLNYIALSRSKAVNWILEILNLNTLDDYNIMMERLLGNQEELTIDEIKKFSRIALETASTKKTDPIPALEDIEIIYSKSMTLIQDQCRFLIGQPIGAGS